MFGNSSESSRSRFGAEPVIIGVFAYASDARRALHVLHEHHFASEQLAAAFREPASERVEPVPRSSAGGDSGKWFGHLRQIYRGNDGSPNRIGRQEEPSGTDAGTLGFEAMLARIDISAEDALTFNRDLDHGAAIVTVRAGVRNQEAQTLLEQRGARILQSQIAKPAEACNPGSVVINSTPFVSPQTAAPDHIQLFGEVLRVHKDKVSSGDVKVRKESTTRMETVQVPVTREHLVVEHTDGTGGLDEEHTLRIPLSEERVVVNKDTVLREEYKVGKREVTQNESIQDTVRRERLLIDDASGDKKG